MIEYELARNFLVAIALGVLIGLEREYAKIKKRGHDYAGIRTFPLITLFGAVSALFAHVINIWILIVNTLLMGAMVIVSYQVIASHNKKHSGTTSEVAGFLAFFIGVLCFFGQLEFAIALAVLITVILYARSLLHTFAKKIKQGELRDTLKFAVVAFVILPFLPNQAYGPFGIFNPYIIWLMVVLISGISFAGYILMKWFGERGIIFGGVLGGLVSSTAVTTSFAERSKKEKKIVRSLLLGVLLANAIMFARILLEVFILNKTLFMELVLPMGILFLGSILISIFIWLNAKDVKGKIKLDSPFTLKPALKFGIFFAVILALIKVADYYLSSKGVYIVSFISGLADVDAITVSLSQLSNGDMPLEIAKRGIMIAALTNVAVKGGIAYMFGSKGFGWKVILLFSLLIALGVVLMFFV